MTDEDLGMGVSNDETVSSRFRSSKTSDVKRSILQAFGSGGLDGRQKNRRSDYKIAPAKHSRFAFKSWK